MTRPEAQARADQLNREAPDRAEHRWTVREREDRSWEVVALTVPGRQMNPGPSRTATVQRPEPGEPPDPRPSLIRNIPPYGPS